MQTMMWAIDAKICWKRSNWLSDKSVTVPQYWLPVYRRRRAWYMVDCTDAQWRV